MLPGLVDRTEYICSLYLTFKEDLLKVREKQRKLNSNWNGMRWFDDVEGELHYLLIRDKRPKVCVEFGPGSGWSTSWILQGLLDNQYGRLIAMDVTDLAKVNLPPELLSYADFILGNCYDPGFFATMPAIDYLHWDADHREEYVQIFLDAMFEKVRGIACFHDVFYQANTLAADSWGIATARPVINLLSQKGIPYFTAANCFTENYAKIDACRKSIGINDVIYANTFNTTLVFEAKETIEDQFVFSSVEKIDEYKNIPVLGSLEHKSPVEEKRTELPKTRGRPKRVGTDSH